MLVCGMIMALLLLIVAGAGLVGRGIIVWMVSIVRRFRAGLRLLARVVAVLVRGLAIRAVRLRPCGLRTGYDLRDISRWVAEKLGTAPVATEVDPSALIVREDLRVDLDIWRHRAEHLLGRFG